MDLSLLRFIVIVPGALALALFIVFTYLYQQIREPYFRAWQWGWAAYFVSYGFLAWYLLRPEHQDFTAVLLLGVSKLLYTGMAMAIYVSTRIVNTRYRYHWTDAAFSGVLALWVVLTVPASIRAGGPLQLGGIPVDPELGFCALLLFCAYRFLRIGQRTRSFAFRLLALALTMWSVLLALRQFDFGLAIYFGGAGHMLGPLPQTLIGIAMLTVLYENERRNVQENLLAFSHLEVDFSRVLSLEELAPSVEKLLTRLSTLTRAEQVLLYVLEPFRGVLPCGQLGFPADFIARLENEVGQAMGSLLKIRSADSHSQWQELPISVLRSQADAHLVRLAEMLEEQQIQSVTVMAIETRDRELGVLLLPQKKASQLGASQVGLLMSLALQLGTTLEKYALLHESQRRTKEFQLLTELGQVVSSRLDQDEVLAAIHRELSRLINTSVFYVGFQDEHSIRMAFEIEDGKLLPKRERPTGNGFTEHIIRTGQPLLIESDLETVRDQLGVMKIGKPAKSFCGVPIIHNAKPVGMMAAMHYGLENVFHERDLELMQTAARQLAIAMENARLFSQEQRRSRYLGFLNSVSKIAISSQNADKMLADIVSQIQQNFHFDHIGVGILDYTTKEIEIKAEAGTTAKAFGKRIPLGVGIMGRVARTNQRILEQGKGDHLLGIMTDSRSALCIPISYGETLLGILNIESRSENAFLEEEILILQTLADLLSTALHNVFVFQKMEHQSITDALTGIKTRRFFTEAVQSEFKRASRSGRPFSVVLIDLDKFKEVNDTMGHLEGDLVLARIGRLLDQKVRQSNVVARYGGDEFMILMPETGVEQASILSERLRLWIATDPMLNERHVTGSFGVAEFPLHGSSVEDIIREADAGMYISKRSGGNKVSSVEAALQNDPQTEQRQMIAAHLENLLQREHIPNASEIVNALKRFVEYIPAEKLREVLMEALRTINQTVEAREMHSQGHGDTVCSYAQAIARELSFGQREMEDLTFAAQVHDVGKIVVPERLLNKATALTFDEFQLMKSHTVVGAALMDIIPDSQNMRDWILFHQERYDGGGYPNGLKGEEIPLGARIIAVAEAYVNMTTDRAYADGKTPVDAMQELEKASGTQFDGMLVRVLIRQLKGTKSARV
ncbi:MAG TPA: diguanylate cyclase [Terriglobales bacterium]|nr:diguanylate cyclase [Terriglobales bacterium]